MPISERQKYLSSDIDFGAFGRQTFVILFQCLPEYENPKVELLHPTVLGNLYLVFIIYIFKITTFCSHEIIYVTGFQIKVVILNQIDNQCLS